MAITTSTDSISGKTITVKTGSDVPQSSKDREASERAKNLKKRIGLAEFQGRIKRTTRNSKGEIVSDIPEGSEEQFIEVLEATDKASKGDRELLQIAEDQENQRLKAEAESKRLQEEQFIKAQIERENLKPMEGTTYENYISTYRPRESDAGSSISSATIPKSDINQGTINKEYSFSGEVPVLEGVKNKGNKATFGVNTEYYNPEVKTTGSKAFQVVAPLLSYDFSDFTSKATIDSVKASYEGNNFKASALIVFANMLGFVDQFSKDARYALTNPYNAFVESNVELVLNPRESGSTVNGGGWFSYSY